MMTVTSSDSAAVIQVELVAAQVGWLVGYLSLVVEDADAQGREQIFGADVDAVDELRFWLMKQLRELERTGQV